MNRSDSINELAAALAKAQRIYPAVKKGETATVPTKAGSSYTYKYADLADIVDALRAPLSDNGIALIQAVSTYDGMIAVETTLAHASGQWISHTVNMPVSGDARAVGSAITYGRRYGLCITGIVTEDDDDAEAATKQRSQRQPTRTEIEARNESAGRYNGNGHDEAFNAMPSAGEERASTPAAQIIARLRKEAARNTTMPTGEDGEKAVRKMRANLSNLCNSNADAMHHAVKVIFGRTSSKDLTTGECNAFSGWIRSTKQNDDTWLPSQDAINEWAVLLKEYPLTAQPA